MAEKPVRIAIPTEPRGSIPHAADAAADRRAIPIPETRGFLTGRGAALRPRAIEASGHFAIDPRVETPEQVRDRILEGAEYIPIDRLGTTDDCGFSPFCDDTSTSRTAAFANIRARVLGTELVSRTLGGS